MAIRNIVKEGDPILRKVCRPVDQFDEKLHRLLDDMHETLDKAEGVGLAAPQVGFCRRFFIMHKGGGMDDRFFHGCTSQKFFCIVSQLSGKIDSHGKICAYIFRQNMLY